MEVFNLDLAAFLSGFSVLELSVICKQLYILHAAYFCYKDVSSKSIQTQTESDAV